MLTFCFAAAFWLMMSAANAGGIIVEGMSGSSQGLVLEGEATQQTEVDEEPATVDVENLSEDEQIFYELLVALFGTPAMSSDENSENQGQQLDGLMHDDRLVEFSGGCSGVTPVSWLLVFLLVTFLRRLRF